ncbi:hypothetical protein KAI46_01820 [bacterium]|nr:hypothetical protein [bacterium]
MLTTDAYASWRPLIGAQISVLEGQKLKECEAYFRELKELGYNTIILRVFHNRGDRFHGLVENETHNLKSEGVYFTTQKVPVIANILSPLCTCAHRSGLKVIAWMNTLKADYNHSLKKRVLTYNEKLGKIEADGTLLEPDNQDNIAFLVHLFQDLATHPIDGILLQDDLILRHNQGFKIVNREVSPAPDDLYRFTGKNHSKIKSYKPAFKRWRQQQALTYQALANKIFSTCRQLRPNLICAQNIHYELLYKEEWSRDWFACTKEALNTSQADYFMVMAYQERIQRELELNPNELTTAMNKIFDNAQQWQKNKLIFKFETSPQTNPNESDPKLLLTLHNTINQARQHSWRDLILTPCNNLGAASSIITKVDY